MEKILFNKKELNKNIINMAKILEKYMNTLDIQNDNILFIGLLNGCIHFVSDLTRNIKREHKLAFLKASSYINNKQEELHLLGNIPEVRGYHVIVLDDICDTGKTLKKVTELLEEEGALSVKTCVLLNKILEDKEYTADFKVFDIDKYFVYGYGLDYNDYKRNLPDIRIKID